jgi:serine/threonine protein kinase
LILKLDGCKESDAVSQMEQEKLFESKFEQKYKRLEKLGEGCSSEVIKCEDKELKVIRAAKIIRSDDDEYIQIAKKEFSLLQSLSHPGVV